MEIVERNNNWILYKDMDGYYLNSRCSWGAVEPTAVFQLLQNEIEQYIKDGHPIIHELAKDADSPSSKEFYEQERPIAKSKLIAMYACAS